MYLVHGRLGQARIALIKAALLRFPGAEDGRAFLKEGGFAGNAPDRRSRFKK